MMQGIENFRDFGGYAAGPGKRVRRGQLYRSAHLAGATAEDLATLAALDIGVIVDLRRRFERLACPTPTSPWLLSRHLVTSDLGGDDDPWLTFLRGRDVSAAAVRGYLHRFYVGMPLEPRHVALFSLFFQALATLPGPILVHCAAGKDRTGVIVALTQMLLGVHRDDIVADYLITNRARPFEAMREPVTRLIIDESGGKVPSDEALRIAIEVEPALLDAAFDAIIRHCGSFDRYFGEVLKLSTPQRQAILDRLLIKQ